MRACMVAALALGLIGCDGCADDPVALGPLDGAPANDRGLRDAAPTSDAGAFDTGGAGDAGLVDVSRGADGGASGDGAAPSDGAVSSDAAASSDGGAIMDAAAPSDGAVSSDAAAPTDGAVSRDGASTADSSATIDAGAAADDAASDPDATPVFGDGGVGDGAPSGDGAPTSDASLVADAASSSDAATTTDGDATPDDAATDLDGGAGPDLDAGAGARDASPADATPDGGPLDDPHADFCMGSGAVVSLGPGDDCADDVATSSFRFGLCACDNIAVGAQLAVDAFDSRVGPYGGSNVVGDGHLGVNQGPLALSGRLLEHGSVFVGGGGFAVGPNSSVDGILYCAGDAFQAQARTTIGQNAFIDGDVTGRFEIGGDLNVPISALVDARVTVVGTTTRGVIPTVTPCRCDPSELVDVGGFVTWGALHNDNAMVPTFMSTAWESGGGPDLIELGCGRYYVTHIAHPGSLTIRATDRVVLFVDGDIDVQANLTVEIEPGAELDLFIAGGLAASGAATIGSTNTPALVRIYVGGGNMIDLSAAARFGGNLYAPTADVVFGASARIYGALFVYHASFPAAAAIHYDSAIRFEAEACEEPTDGGVADAGAGTDGSTGADGGFEADALVSSDAGVGSDALVTDGGAAADGAVTNDGGVVLDAWSDLDSGAASDATGGSDGGVALDADLGLDASGPDDASVPGCSSCSDCEPRACIIPAGASVGMCGPCTGDLDCCPPFICSQGWCVPSL